MKIAPFFYAMILTMVIGVGLALVILNMAIKHVFVQISLDASTDAAAVQLDNLDRYSLSGELLQTRFAIDPYGARIAAQNTFEKNLNNMMDLSIDTSSIGTPTYTFPTDRTVAGEVSFEHDFNDLTDRLNRFFEERSELATVEDQVDSVSTFRKERVYP